LAGRPVDDLHLDRDARWREHLDRSPAGRIAERATREQVGAGDGPVTEAEDRVGRDRQVDHGRSRGRRIGMATRGSPAEDRVRRSLPGRRRDRRPAADDRAKIDLRVASKPATWTWNRPPRMSGLAEPRKSVTAATRTSLPDRPSASGSRRRATGRAPVSSSMTCSQRSASPVGLGTKSEAPTWFAAYVPGMIVSEPDWPAGAQPPGP